MQLVADRRRLLELQVAGVLVHLLLELPDACGQLAARIRKLEQQMYQHARDLEFEQAASVRDELHRLKEQGFAA